MRLKALLMVTVLLAATAVAQDDGAKKELKKFEGNWVLVSGEKDGEKISAEVVKAARLSIKGNKHVVKVGDDTIVGTHEVDPTKKPKLITSMDTEGPFKDKTVLGIYEITGDTFKVCFAPPDKDRPKEFTSKSGTGVLVHVWKRAKN